MRILDMKTLIVIPCSNRKRGGGDKALAWRQEESATRRLSREAADRLLDCRRELAKRFGYPEGEDLGGAPTAPVPLMPACLRYDGNLYRKIEEALCSRVARSSSTEVIVVSALYGLVALWEPIRYYNVAITDSITRGPKLARWWSEQGLGHLVVEYVERSRASVVHDFLSGAYTDVAEALEDIEAPVKVYRHSYPGLGSGADHHRGWDVRKLLLHA